MLYVIGLPHTSLNKKYGTCAYTQKLLKFMKMFPEATVYSNEGTEVPFTQIFSKEDMDRLFMVYEWYEKGEVYKVDYDPNLEYWHEFNGKVIAHLRSTIQPHDIICLIAGWSQKEIADAFPNNIVTEFGVGYEGVFSKYRVFESYAWMHHVYGLQKQKNGSFFDAVIPNFFDVNDFPYSRKKEDYLLFMSRPVDRKGIQIIKDIAKAGHQVIVAGQERFEGKNIKWIGYADTKKRGMLMSKAKAVLMPTLYIEPFGGVGVEAQLCGTPVISTDWGAFSETVEQGVSGYRCRTFQEFLTAVDQVGTLDPKVIRERAIRLYSLETVKLQYERYFKQLDTLWDKGWYTIAKKK